MKNLKKLRQKSGLTQIELSEKMGIKQSTLSAWENEEIAPKSERLPALAKALNCTIDELYGEE